MARQMTAGEILNEIEEGKALLEHAVGELRPITMGGALDDQLTDQIEWLDHAVLLTGTVLRHLRTIVDGSQK